MPPSPWLAPPPATWSLSCVLDRGGSLGRNFYTYSTFGILLVLAGSRILLAGVTASAVWSALAVGCIWAGVWFGRLTSQVHGGIYLLLALAGSGALRRPRR